MPIIFDHAVIYNGKYYPARVEIAETVRNTVGGAESVANAQPDKETVSAEKPTTKATKGRKKAAGEKA